MTGHGDKFKCRSDDEIFKGDLRAPIWNTWKISDFMALKRMRGTESIFFFHFSFFKRGM